MHFRVEEVELLPHNRMLYLFMWAVIQNKRISRTSSLLPGAFGANATADRCCILILPICRPKNAHLYSSICNFLLFLSLLSQMQAFKEILHWLLLYRANRLFLEALNTFMYFLALCQHISLLSLVFCGFKGFHSLYPYSKSYTVEKIG